MGFSLIVKAGGAALLFLLLAACGGGPERLPVIAEAFVGPAVLKIRGDIPLDAATVAVVKHGEKLQVLQRRRRFLRVRTPNGSEGWTDERQLLGAEDMKNLQALADRAAKLPAQGQGSAWSELNVHTLPHRQSPSFLQIKEKEKVDVLGHVTVERTQLPRKSVVPPPPKKETKKVTKPKKEPKYPPPPMPRPPSPPANWLDLSKTLHEEDTEEDAAEDDAPEVKPLPTDDWSLVRTHTGQAGWILTRRLVMAIPDEVAQYAEGRQIVSYFRLADTLDGGERKPTWLWTTVGSGDLTYDFDNFRVFVWSIRRHRYETSYIERNVKGYLPVIVRAAGETGDASFSICLENRDGQRVRREYVMMGNMVRSSGEKPCEVVPLLEPSAGNASVAALPTLPPETHQPRAPGLFDRAWNGLHSTFNRLFGH